MRNYTERTVFQDVDPGDQPKASKVFFTVIGQTMAIYYVDGIDHGALGESQGVCAYRIDEHGNRVDVIQLSPGTPWHIVDASYIEAETLGQMYTRRVRDAHYMGSFNAAYEKAQREGMVAGQFAQAPAPPSAQPPRGTDESDELRRFRKIMEQGFGGEEVS